MESPDLVADPLAPDLPLDALGWVGRDPQSEEVCRLRDYLDRNSGIRGLEVLAPDEVDRARQIFYRDGFVVVRDALDARQLDQLRAATDRVVHEMMALDRSRTGNRGSHRYSFGSASKTGAQLHHPEWAMLMDLPTVTPILTEIFGNADYTARSGGGDFCLPGAAEYQPLHSDMGDRREISRKQGREPFVVGAFHDPRGLMNYRDLPCPYICCNFLMVDFTSTNGPTRQIPGTQHSQQPMPNLSEEPEWMKLSTVCPAPAGSVLIRDVRAWHGGTPNLSNEVRAIPNAEFFASWFREPVQPCIPRDIFEKMTPHARRVCRELVGDDLDLGYRRNLGGTPAGSRSRSMEDPE